MRQNYDWIQFLSMAVYGLLYLVALGVCWLGWRRKRHIGYFVLCVWALVAVVNVFVASPVINASAPLLRKFFPGSDPTAILVLGHTFAHTVPFLVFLAGLALLVFRENPPPGPGDPSA